MIKTIKHTIILFVLASGILFSCGSGNRWNPDVHKIKADVKFIRLEKEIFSIDTAHFQDGMMKLIHQHKDEMRFFMTQLHNFGRWGLPGTLDSFDKIYLKSRYMRDSLYPDVEKAFPDPVISDLEGQFSDAFRHIKYYFPNDTLPKVFTTINPFGNIQTYTYGNDLFIALEYFLGENYRYYNSFDLPTYKLRVFKKEYIMETSLKTWFQSKYDVDKLTDQTLLSKMIYAGKRLFYLDVMKPDMPDTIKIEYTASQLKWCKDYQADMWNHLVSKNLLYNTNEDRVDKYIEEGPFTNDADVPQESSPRIGEWVGWQIVKKYMDENPKVTLDELFKDRDYRKILTQSRYKPG